MRMLFLGLMAFSGAALASESLELDYATLYSHTRKLDKDELSALQFAFGFMHHQSKQMCHLESAYLHTQKQDIPLQITQEQRFTVPSEKALSLAKAVARFELTEPVNQCDMSVQLETKAEYLKTAYDLQELVLLYDQYTEFFDSMGSFLAFMMPSVKGLVLHFDKNMASDAIWLNDKLQPELSIREGELRLSKDWLENKGQLRLPVRPYRITAITE
ncbi:DUF2987 domain-containing protein [Bowmanella denitrificans]|uniref:DUF2987 domain-containing protein n=1 Tax=Bowmanella denitrificans TaxID=366582 RepID=UPI000C99E1F4|nr:DUF2987 domain-containing protein [Bowmanella denitrificans]